MVPAPVGAIETPMARVMCPVPEMAPEASIAVSFKLFIKGLPRCVENQIT